MATFLVEAAKGIRVRWLQLLLTSTAPCHKPLVHLSSLLM